METDIENMLCSVELVDSNHVLNTCEVLVAEWDQPLTNFLCHLHTFQVIEPLHVFYCWGNCCLTTAII